jgi:hypothetical protein
MSTLLTRSSGPGPFIFVAKHQIGRRKKEEAQGKGHKESKKKRVLLRKSSHYT